MLAKLLLVISTTYLLHKISNKKRHTIDKLNLTIKNLGLGTNTPPKGITTYPLLKNKNKKPYGWELIYTLPYGITIKDFQDRKLEFNTAINGEVEFEMKDGMLKMTVMENSLPKYIKFEIPEINNDIILPIFLGYSRKGIEVIDLTDVIHLLVGGIAGSGKSNFLHQVVGTLLYYRKNVHITIIDMKRIEFNYLRELPNVTFACDLDSAIGNIEYLHNEMHRRMELFDKLGINHIKDCKRDDISYEVLLIDEFSHLSPDLVKGNKVLKTKRAYAHALLIEIIVVARALGIHIILCTQRPDAQIVPGQLKAEFGAVMSFRTMNDVNSRILLDNSNAAYIPNIPGRAIFQWSNEKDIQVCLTPRTLVKNILRSVYYE